MKKPNKIYTLTIVYNDDSEEVEKSSVLVDLSDYWDEDTLKLLKDHYYIAEA